jgi:cobalt/nickel transport system ATP-binding protein
MPAVSFEDVSYSYPDGTPAIERVSFAVEAGEAIALLGPTGAGKSTLLLHLNGLVLPASGRVVVDGLTVSEESAREVRRRVGLVFQDPDDQLFLPTLLEDVAFGPINEGRTPAEAEVYARQVLSDLGLDGHEGRAAHHLSGGEKRLAALATVLVSRPGLLALDEPTSNLDAKGRRCLVDLLRARTETLIVATHDLDVARALCSRGVVLDSGSVAYDGPLERLLGDFGTLERHGLAVSLE